MNDSNPISGSCLCGRVRLNIKELNRHIFVDDKGDYNTLEPGVPTFAQSD